MKILLVFWEKKFIWDNLIFLAFRPFFYCLIGHGQIWARPLLIGFLNNKDMISFMITTGSLNSQDMIRILKQWRHDFLGKYLCWIFYEYYVMFMCGGQNSWFCKASLRICYISLFECKGPWMLKTVINCHVWNRGLQN